MAALLKATIIEDSISKEDLIVKAATKEFLKKGYTQANMKAIADIAGVSKQTIYTHFGSKENLFNAIIKHIFRRVQQDHIQILPNTCPEKALAQFLTNMLSSFYSKEGIAMYRLVMAEGPNNEKLNKVFISRMERGLARIATHIGTLETLGLVEVPSCEKAAEDLICKCKNLKHMKLLCGYDTAITQEEIEYIAHDKAREFLQKYAKNKA